VNATTLTSLQTGRVEPTETTAPPAIKIEPRAYARQKIYNDYLEAAREGTISFLKYYRIRKGMEQAELGRRVGMKQSAIARAERVGQVQKMRGETLKKLASALGITVDELLR
jgi:DNA-binding Xre family transcriptional regulator